MGELERRMLGGKGRGWGVASVGASVSVLVVTSVFGAAGTVPCNRPKITAKVEKVKSINQLS